MIRHEAQKGSSISEHRINAWRGRVDQRPPQPGINGSSAREGSSHSKNYMIQLELMARALDVMTQSRQR